MHDSDGIRICPRCNGYMSKLIFDIEGNEVCEDCFCEWATDYAKTNPEDVAKLLQVEVSVGEEN